MLSCTTSTPLVANRLPGARPILRPFQSSTKAIRLITSTAAHKSNDASTNQQSASFVDPMTTSAAVACTFFLSEAAAHADAIVSDNPFQGVQSNSLYVTLALFLMSVPGTFMMSMNCMCFHGYQLNLNQVMKHHQYCGDAQIDMHRYLVTSQARTKGK
jgi:hypothetical protein